MIKKYEPNENEVKCWTVAVGNLPGLFGFINRKKHKATMAALAFITRQEGFIGIHPVPPHGTLCIFKTENNAKAARNVMRAEGIQVGKNICEVYVDKRFIKD